MTQTSYYSRREESLGATSVLTVVVYVSYVRLQVSSIAIDAYFDGSALHSAEDP